MSVLDLDQIGLRGLNRTKLIVWLAGTLGLWGLSILGLAMRWKLVVHIIAIGPLYGAFVFDSYGAHVAYVSVGLMYYSCLMACGVWLPVRSVLLRVALAVLLHVGLSFGALWLLTVFVEFPGMP